MKLPLATIVIEDSSIVRETLIPALQELASVEVVATAETACEGIAALRELADAWQLVVVDLLLKEGNGLQVLRAARGRRGDQHIIVLTNYATPDVRRKSIELGADAVFDKSTEIDEFLELCKQYSAERPLQNVDNSEQRETPVEDSTVSQPREAGALGELIERVVVDRLLTEAVSDAVQRNASTVRAHLTRQVSIGSSEQGAAAGDPGSEPMDKSPGLKPTNP